MKYSKWLDRSLFRGPHIALCVNATQHKKLMKHLGIVDPKPFMHTNGLALCSTYQKDGSSPACVVSIDIKKVSPKDITYAHSVLVHEALHVWQITKDFIGEPNPSIEFEAYSVENICRKLFEEFERLTK